MDAAGHVKKLGTYASDVFKCKSGERPIDVVELAAVCRPYGRGRVPPRGQGPLERTGMSGTRPGAQAMLHLRAIWTCDQWEEFDQYRIEHETAR